MYTVRFSHSVLCYVVAKLVNETKYGRVKQERREMRQKDIFTNESTFTNQVLVNFYKKYDFASVFDISVRYASIKIISTFILLMFFN